MDILSIFAVAAPGLEQVLADELREFGIQANAEQGGAGWDGSFLDLLDANLKSRTATRILVRAATFRSRTFHELERHAARVPWHRFLADDGSVRLRVTCRKSKLYHAGAVAQRLLEAIEAATGIRGQAVADADEDGSHEEIGQLFVVRMIRDVCTISADSTGDLLHRRGYREAVAKAPLRETLAAAMIRSSGWHAQSSLLDPFCGSGTIPIEAALIARNIAPAIARASRRPRQFQFERWPEHDPGAWHECVERAVAAIRDNPIPPLFASDRNSGAIRAAQSNAERAGVAGNISFEARAFGSAVVPTPTGWIVTNPPYGVRIGRRDDAERTVADIRQRASSDFAQWAVALLTASGKNGPHSKEPASRPDVETADDVRFETRNGGIPVTFRVLRQSPS